MNAAEITSYIKKASNKSSSELNFMYENTAMLVYFIIRVLRTRMGQI